MAGHRRKTPLRTLQAEDALWIPFEDAAETAGSSRPDLLREFMGWVNDNPKLWADVRAEAERRGETMRAVVQRQLRAYLDALPVRPERTDPPVDLGDQP